MEVYRITLAKWSNSLKASGCAARWNSGGNFVIYTAQSRSLACLENLVHRSGESLGGNFKVLTINIPDSLKIIKLDDKLLAKNWQRVTAYSTTQALGDKWLNEAKSAVLCVPSALIQGEFNYLINPLHVDFARIELKFKSDFSFDQRLKIN